MLPRANRVTAGKDFRRAVRDGRRSGTRAVVVHLVLPAGRTSAEEERPPLPTPPTVGFVVSRAVGNAVTRNRVKRRLRHLCAERLGSLPSGAVVVVRALPPAATLGTARLAADLDGCLRNVTKATA